MLITRDMKNIILIGMPGAGKSTLGVLLAKALNMNFADTDLDIQRYTGELLYKTIENRGINDFLNIEQKVICETNYNNTVIATGGSAVYGEKAMAHLKSDGIVIYIDLSCEEIIRRVSNITTRGVVMKAGKTMADVYAERVPLYKKYADYIVLCEGKSIEESVSIIKDLINE